MIWLIYIHISTAALCIRPALPFKCEKCERTYKTKDSLYNHKRVCGLDPSFSCAKCDYRTAHNHHMRRHLTNVHNVERSQLASFGAANGIFILMAYCYSVVVQSSFDLIPSGPSSVAFQVRQMRTLLQQQDSSEKPYDLRMRSNSFLPLQPMRISCFT